MSQSPGRADFDEENGNWDQVRDELARRFGGSPGSSLALDALAVTNSRSAQKTIADFILVEGAFAVSTATCVYRIVVATGTAPHAGTDSNVYLTLYGPQRVSREIMLSSSRDAFERGLTDTFSTETVDVGELKAIRIRHDNSGGWPGWFLASVRVTRETPPVQEWVFPCERWLAVDEDDGAISRLLFPVS